MRLHKNILIIVSIMFIGFVSPCAAQDTQETAVFFATYDEFKNYFNQKDYTNKEEYLTEFLKFLSDSLHWQNSPAQAGLSLEQKSDNIKVFTNWWSKYSVELIKGDKLDIKDFVYYNAKVLSHRAHSLHLLGNTPDAVQAQELLVLITKGTYHEFRPNSWLSIYYADKMDYARALDYALDAKAALEFFKTNPSDHLVVKYTNMLGRIASLSWSAGKNLKDVKTAYEAYFDHGIANDSLDVNIKELSDQLSQYKSLLKELKSNDKIYIDKVNAYLRFLETNPTETLNDGRVVSRQRAFDKQSPEALRAFASQLETVEELKTSYYLNFQAFIEAENDKKLN